MYTSQKVVKSGENRETRLFMAQYWESKIKKKDQEPALRARAQGFYVHKVNKDSLFYFHEQPRLEMRTDRITSSDYALIFGDIHVSQRKLLPTGNEKSKVMIRIVSGNIFMKEELLGIFGQLFQGSQEINSTHTARQAKSRETRYKTFPYTIVKSE